MSKTEKQIDWDAMLAAAGPYPIEAFCFVRDGLTFTAQRVHADYESLAEHDRHISGAQLCIGLRDYAIERYGRLARTVLNYWHIHRTEDFGRIVFSMIDHGLMTRTSEDSIEDFRSVYDFDEAFSQDELQSRQMTG